MIIGGGVLILITAYSCHLYLRFREINVLTNNLLAMIVGGMQKIGSTNRELMKRLDIVMDKNMTLMLFSLKSVKLESFWTKDEITKMKKGIEWQSKEEKDQKR